MDIKLRQIRRQCFVPGCNNFDTFMISGNGEFTPDVIICKDCIDKAYRLLNPKKKKDE